MDGELEALLKAWAAVLDAADEDYQSAVAHYQILLQPVSERTGQAATELDRAIRKRFVEWERAQRKPPDIPPKA